MESFVFVRRTAFLFFSFYLGCLVLGVIIFFFYDEVLMNLNNHVQLEAASFYQLELLLTHTSWDVQNIQLGLDTGYWLWTMHAMLLMPEYALYVSEFKIIKLPKYLIVSRRIYSGAY